MRWDERRGDVDGGKRSQYNTSRQPKMVGAVFVRRGVSSPTSTISSTSMIFQRTDFWNRQQLITHFLLCEESRIKARSWFLHFGKRCMYRDEKRNTLSQKIGNLQEPPTSI